MPTFLVTSPEGKKYRINAPDGSTQEDAINYVRGNFQPPQKTQTSTATEAGTDSAGTPPRSPDVAFLNSEGGGVPAAVGFPIDAINSALGVVGLDSEEPIGGKKSIASLLRKVGIGPREGEQAETLGAQVMEGIGGAAGGLLAGGGIAKALSTLPSTAAGLSYGAQGIKAKLSEEAANLLATLTGKTQLAGNVARASLAGVAAKPLLTTGIDVASGATSGIGGAIAEEAFPDSAVAKATGQVIGGLATPVGISSLTRPVRLGKRALSAAAFPYTPTGATIRAENRVKSLLPDPEAAAASLDGKTISNLSPAQKIGDERMLALEKAVRDQDVNIDEAFRQRGVENIDQLTGEMNKMRGEGSVADTQQQLSSRQEQLGKLLDTRLQQATEKTDQALSKIAPEMRSSQASAVARGELEAALSDARMQEKQLWGEIPDNVLVDKTNTVSTYEKLIKETPRAQQSDIPKALMAKTLRQPAEPATRIYNERGEALLGDKMPVTERITELQGLRSKLLEESRIARSEGKANKARITDMLADSVLEDIGAATGRVQGEVGQKIRDALDFSRTLNEKFTRGEVGKVLGTARTGGDRVAPELTLSSLISGGKTRGGVGVQQMLDAADTPALRGSVEDYLKEQLGKSAMKDGKINPAAARKFINENADILDKFPDLRKTIFTATDATEKLTAKTTRTNVAKKSLVSDSKNQVSKFINAPIDKEFDVILGSRDPAGFTKELVQRAAKDKTGAAAKGLKASAVDYVIRKSSKEGRLNGQALLDSLNSDPRVGKAMAEVLSPEELQRMRRIGGELKAAQASTGKDIGGVINDLPHRLIATPIRIFAAKAGAKFGAGTDGASLITAHIFSQEAKKYLGKLTNDKANEILTHAVQDEQLMKALLTNTTTKPGQKAAAQKLEAWLVGPGATLLDADKEEPKNQ